MFITIIVLTIMVVGAMAMYVLNTDREGKFRKNHEVSETIGRVIYFKTYTKTADAVLEYNVNGSRYTTHDLPFPTMVPGDEFIVLYDKNNPDESIYLKDRPVIPDKDTAHAIGKITLYRKWKFNTEVHFIYSFNEVEYKRAQFFSRDKVNESSELKKMSDNGSTISIIFPMSNPSRGYLNLDKNIPQN